MTAFLNPWFLLAAVLALGGAWGHGRITGDESGAARVQVAWDRADAIATQARAKRIAQAAAVGKQLQEQKDEAHAKQLAAAAERNRQLRADLDGLRKRARRPQPGLQRDVPAVAAAGPADANPGGRCTGAGLYRDDAELLIRLAHAAKLAKSERDYYYAAYERARQALMQLDGVRR